MESLHKLHDQLAVQDLLDLRSGEDVSAAGEAAGGRSAARCQYGEVRIADEQGLALPDFKTGEIQIRRGPVLMTGYVGHPDLAQEVFDGDWFWTGDLGYRNADGWFYFVGRRRR